MIVLDTTILLYAKGADHPLRDPCRDLVIAIERGHVEATTTAEVIQEFTHVRARKRDRRDAAELANAYIDLLAPLLTIEESHVREGLALFEHHPALGSFDAILAAAAVDAGASALASADRAFSVVPALHHAEPGTPAFSELIS